MKIAFVILHYENLRDTKDCIESLVQYLNYDETDIIVIDNGSKKETIDSLKFIYHNIHIHFIISEKNLGFAKGNNIGYLYAKRYLNSEIIILCNNDLIFRQADFIDKLKELYLRDGFDVAGPKIISLVDGKNQNPIPVQYSTINQLNKRIIKYYVLIILNLFNLDRVMQKVFAKPILEYHPDFNDDYQLFGACLIFANNYIKLFDGLYDKTFMYNEESILKERVLKHGLIMKYYEEIDVCHKEGASTELIYGKGRKKRMFYYKWNLHSCLLLKRIKKGIEDI